MHPAVAITRPLICAFATRCVRVAALGRRHCPFLCAVCKVAALLATECCMARDQIDMTPVETRNDLVAWFAEGAKPPSQFRIGTEHEKFAFSVEGHQPVPYEG